MKKIIALLLMAYFAGSVTLFAKGDGDYYGPSDGEPPVVTAEKLFAEPEHGQLKSGIEGEVIWAEADTFDDRVPLLKTPDAVYLLPPARGLQKGLKLKLDAYILQPMEGAELPGFDYEGKKIVPALLVTLASDEDGNILYVRGQGRRGGNRYRGRGYGYRGGGNWDGRHRGRGDWHRGYGHRRGGDWDGGYGHRRSGDWDGDDGTWNRRGGAERY